MPTPLETMRASVQRDLRDETAAIWTANEIDRAIERALADYSEAKPLVLTEAVATTAADDEFSIAGLTATPKWVYAVEFPLGNFPRLYQRVEADLVALKVRFLGDVRGNGDNCNVDYATVHTINASVNTVPDGHQHIVALGAAACAALAYAVSAVNKVNTGGLNVDRDYGSWGRDAMARFKAELKRINRTMTSSRLVSETLHDESGA